MAKTVPLDAPTLAWARGEFARYYRSASVAPPPQLGHREFAAFPFTEAAGMRRHETLPTPNVFASYLRETVPRHVYYSSAYYRHPEAPTMAAKEWQGADLIFDLDADHLRGAAELDYAAQLALVKQRLVDLLDDFLFGDFGISPSQTSLVFSGGRGYHVHVRDERFRSLTSPERRELVDYVLGVGVDPLAAVEEHREDVRSGRTVSGADDEAPVERSAGKMGRALELAPPDAPGWRGRTTRAVLAVLERWERLEAKEAAAEMERFGVPAAEAARWARRLRRKERGSKIRATRSLDAFTKDEGARAFLEAIVRSATVEVQAETDAPVTTDIHRLIRLPDSLHGGTGFRVVPLEREALSGFDPFRDAGWEGAETPTPVTMLEDVSYPFPGGLARTAGATDELPTAQALFLVLRGQAALRASPG